MTPLAPKILLLRRLSGLAIAQLCDFSPQNRSSMSDMGIYRQCGAERSLRRSLPIILSEAFLLQLQKAVNFFHELQQTLGVLFLLGFCAQLTPTF